MPVIAITGHLGAGKTSLLNHLLRAPGARLGVIVNDVGELNVDVALVAGQVDDAVGIAGGCLCCLPDTSGLDVALARLSRPELRLDAILIEASGAAEPLALARLVRRAGGGRTRPAGLIDVLDAASHFETVDLGPTPPLRHAAATLVVIGRTDLLPTGEREDRVARIRERVRARHPRVPIVVADRGRIDPALVLDIAAEEDPPDQLPIARLVRDQAADDHPAAAHADHVHARTCSVRLDGPVGPGALADLLEEPPEGVYRLKGRIAVCERSGMRGYAVHVVGHAVHVDALPTAPVPGELVAIGPDLDVEEAQRRLRQVAASAGVGTDAAGLRRLHRLRRLSA